MKSIIIPDTEQRLNEGSIVILEKYPNTKWIVNTGWYTYGEDQFEGWYFSSIPSNTILPITDEYLTNIQILSNGDTSGDIIDPLPPEDEETEGEPVVDCNCTPTPPVQPSCPTPTPPIVIKSPEKYLGGVWYYSGQLVYLDFGDLYQTTKKFKSSWKLSSLRKNLDADVQSGYLVPVPNTLATEISEQFEGFTTDLNGFEQTLNTFEDKVTALTIRKFLMPFHQAFGTDTPTKEIADNYLSKFDPPIVPSVTVSFRNTDLASSTYGHQFTYYPMPNNPSGLLFMDDTIDTIVDISGKVDKTVAGEGGTIVKSIDTQLEDSGLALKRVSLSLENGETSEDIWKLPLASKQDINTLDNTKVDKSIAGEGETIVQNLAITETVNGFNMKKTLLSLETGEINTVSKVLPLTTKDELEQGLNELQVSILEVNNNKIDKSIAGVNQMMVKSATLSFNQETGSR